MAAADERRGLNGVVCLPADVRALALLLPEAVEGAHQGHPDFRVGGKIFATLWTDEERVVVKLTREMQAVVVEAEPDMFEPAPGALVRRMRRPCAARSWTPGKRRRLRGSSPGIVNVLSIRERAAARG